MFDYTGTRFYSAICNSGCSAACQCHLHVFCFATNPNTAWKLLWIVSWVQNLLAFESSSHSHPNFSCICDGVWYWIYSPCFGTPFERSMFRKISWCHIKTWNKIIIITFNFTVQIKCVIDRTVFHHWLRTLHSHITCLGIYLWSVFCTSK